jgi:RHS repeat-associated protein
MSGNIVTRYDYEPFGKTVALGSPSSNPFKYAGRELDAGVFYYYRARYYHAILTRFLSEDPLDLLEAINLYAYASNNPITFLDPLGLTTWPGRGGVTSSFGHRGGRFPGFHNGVDIANSNGTPVVASNDGVVLHVTPNQRGGNQVAIQHPDGSKTVSSHTRPLVKPGDMVSEGQPIGCTDVSGRTTGSVVHFIYYPPGSNNPADPIKRYLPPKNNYPKNLTSSACSGGTK